MLGDNYTLDLKIEDRTKKLYFSFQTLKNINNLLNVNPLYYIREFLGSENREEYLATLIYCMTNGNIELKDIDIALEDIEMKNYLLINIIAIIMAEIKEENFKVENNENDIDETKEKTEEEILKEWSEYWNYCYYIATIQLRKTEKEFLHMSIRELSTLSRFNKEYYKNILLDTYTTVLKAKNGNGEVEEEESVTVGRFKDIFK